MTEMPLLASLLAGTWCFLAAVRSGRPWSHVGTVLFWTYAIDVKVLAVYWLAACGLWLVLNVGKDLRGLAAVVLPVALHLPLYLTWHALLPPTQDKAFLGIAAVPGFHVGHFNHAMVLLGIFFWPVVICVFGWPRVRWRIIIGLAGILLSLWLLFPPDYQGQAYLGAARGIVARLHLLDHARTVLFLPWVVGCVVAMVFAGNTLAAKEDSTHAIQLASLIVVGGIAAIVVAPAAWDRYFMPFWPVAFLLAVAALDDKPRATFLLVAYNALMAVVLMARYGGVG